MRWFRRHAHEGSESVDQVQESERHDRDVALVTERLEDLTLRQRAIREIVEIELLGQAQRAARET